MEQFIPENRARAPCARGTHDRNGFCSVSVGGTSARVSCLELPVSSTEHEGGEDDEEGSDGNGDESAEALEE